jgi:phage tail sheath protein FI
MATYAHPGVYIEEFTPGSPIEGVGTSTAAFIGTARQGPVNQPTRINSWDEFVATFGDYVHESVRSYLALSVQGFFANGGTDCFIVRVGTAVHAFANLPTINQPGDPLLVVRDPLEGTSTPQLEVIVTLTSLLEDELGTSGPALKVARGSATVSTVSQDRRTVTVSDNRPFATGDRVLLEHPAVTGPPAIPAYSHANEIAALQGQDTIVLARAIPATEDYALGGTGTVRIADLRPGTTAIRFRVPAGLRLSHALPPGSSVKIDTGANDEYGVVASTGTDSVTLTSGLTKAHALTADVDVRSLEFDLEIRRDGVTVDTLPYRSMNPGHPSWWGAIDSEFITLEEPPAPPGGVIRDPRPRGGTYPLQGAQDDDRAAAWGNLLAAPAPTLQLLAPFDDVAIVAVPGAFDTIVHKAIVDHCEQLYDRFAILDSKPGDSLGDTATLAAGATGRDRGFAALYYPWIQVMNPVTRKLDLWPPSGHMAGIYAASDTTRGVHKAPANVTIRGALGLERRITDAQQDTINLKGVNALRILPGSTVPRVWGARTTTTVDRNWQYINIRRLFLFMEESIQEGIQWAVFEPNDLALWQKLRRTITEFLTRVWRDGALFGATAQDAFYVRIDEALNPESTRRLGRLYIEIGVVPTYPAEFIVVRIGIWDRGSEITES